MALTIFHTERFADHLNPPGHPERHERAEVMTRVAASFVRDGGHVRTPRPVSDEAILRVHDAAYLASLREVAGKAVALDPDTFTSPDTVDVALLAAGAATDAVDHVLAGPPGTRALALVRPPGHHAERHRAMGFCLLNNIAIAAAHARAKWVARVAIVDIDVHHGNGTQWAFYDDPTVLFVSSHQHPFYPGTGAPGDVGRGAGYGFTVNLAIEAGATDDDVWLAYHRVALPILDQFKPELVLISAGFDGHQDDPLGGWRATTQGFAQLIAALVEAANVHAGGRVVAVTEGGYDLAALHACLSMTVQVLDDRQVVEWPTTTPDAAPRGARAVSAVTPGLSRIWTL